MSRYLKWAYSVGFFLAMCGVLSAGTYQYLDNLSIPYNINIFGCGTASCTSMVLQNSGGTEILTPAAPGAVQLSPNSIAVGAGQDGWDSTQGAKGDAPVFSGPGSVIALLKGILTELVTPITVTGNVTATPVASPAGVAVVNTPNVSNTPVGSPQNVTVANIPTVSVVSPLGVGVVNNVAVTTPTPLQVTLPASPISVGIAGPSPLNVTSTLSGSPVSVGIAAGSSPLNVTGNFSVSSPLGVNIASSPVQVTLPASPVSVGVTNTVNVTPPTPLQVTLPASPISVGISATPLNVTVGNIASPAGVAVVNQPTVVLSGSPVSVGITAGSSPINVTTPSPLNVTGSFNTTVSSPLGVVPFNGASPQNVTMSSPVSVAISTVSSPVNVTGNLTASVSSPLGVNIASSPVQVTLPASPISVAIAGPTPLAVTLPSTPVEVAISTVSSPINVTGNISTTISSPAAMNLTQVQNVNVASPSTYGVAPAGSVLGTNAFVTNNVAVTTPTPLQITLPASPISVGLSASPAGVAVVNNVAVTTPTPLQVTLPASPISVGIAGPTPLNVTVANVGSPQSVVIGTSPVGVSINQIQGTTVSSPSTYGVAPAGSVLGVNAFVTSLPASPVSVALPATPLNVTISGSPQSVVIAGPTPLAVTLPSTPVEVAISSVSSPINVTGSITANSSSPTTVNLGQVQNVNIASPSTYGVAPVGSVQGVNAAITNSPTVVLSGSPVSVGIAGPTPLNVTIAGSPQSVVIAGPTPLAVTLPSTPVEVAISTVSSPLNVTGTFTSNSSSPTTINLGQVQNVNIASPSTYGVAPVGSVEGVNAFVTSLPASPLGVALAGPSPLNVTVGSPQNVTFTGSPISVAVAASPIGTNLLQVQGTKIASPATYGVAPVGSVEGVNAFVTNNVSVTTPTPLQVTLPASPISVAIAGPTPLNVTVASPQANNVVQMQSVNLASPSTYGVAPVGSTQGVNAFITNGNPNGSAVMASSQPVTVASDQTPISVNIIPGAATNTNVIAWTASSVFNVTNTAIALGATPGIVGVHQLNGANCTMNSTITTPASVFLEFFDATPHASGTDVVLGTTLPTALVAIAGSPLSQGLLNIGAPGMRFTKGITIALVATPTGSNAVGTKAACSFTYN